ncbi:MAG: hypothetical protein IKW90_12865, partial [Lachnospiraceae bacterium]|nr:hypothetical protein [Lachnospiraceae bacterium]
PVDLVVYSSFSSAPGSGVSAQISYTDSSNSTKTIKVPSSAFEYQQNDNLYRVEFKDIPLDSLTTPLTVVFKNNTKDISATITYSCESYAKSILGGSYDANVKDLVKKMLVYGDSAKAYAATLPTGCVTYRQFGAMGIYDESKTDNFEDYYPLIMTHDYANLKNLPVKADEGAHYYAKNMNPRCFKGALIKTDTDWGEANFTIDDKVLGTDKVGKSPLNKQFTGDTITEGHCFLFSVEPSKPNEYKYSNPLRDIYLGLDADLSTAIPNYPDQHDSNARKLKNKTFTKDTTMFEGDFKEKALYVLATQSVKRWARNDKGKELGRDQEEVLIISKTVTGKDGKKYGVLDDATPLEWDWQQIYKVYKYPIDEKTIYVKGGTFNTIVNTEKKSDYIYRGISVTRSNVVVEGVKHYLKGEEDNFAADCYSTVWKRNVARSGAPYYGFIYLDHCAYVTIKNCRFTDHLRGWFLNNSDSSSTAPYDFTAEQCAAITLDGCECVPTSVGENGKYVSDPTGIMDNVVRWGTMGTNYLKTFTVKNCKFSRVDAHKGVYNLTVTDSELGILGIAAVGFGTMRVERVLSHAVNFISLRRDFGSAWFGDIEVNDCTWDITNNSINPFFETMYDPTVTYCYDTVEKGGKTYYSQLPTNVTINNFTVDASKLGEGDAFYANGISIFDKVIFKTDKIDENYLSEPKPHLAVQYWADDKRVEKYGYPYYYPIKAPEHVTVNNVKVINSSANKNSKISGVGLRVPGAQDMYFFDKEYDKTEFKWNNVVKYSVAD